MISEDWNLCNGFRSNMARIPITRFFQGNYMSGIKFAIVAAAMTVLLSTTPLQAQSRKTPQAATQKEEIALLQKQSQEADAAGEWVALYVANMKLNQIRPYEPGYMVNIIRACALLDRKSTAYHFMLKMQQQGMSYDFNSIEDTLQIRDTEAYEYINNMLIDAGKPAGVGTVAFTLPGSPADFRAIAWDQSRNSFLVGTIREGALIAVSVDGETEVLLEADDENGLWSISDLAVDVKSNRLWVSSTATPLFAGFSPADMNHGALFEFDLNTMEIVGRYNLPVDGIKHELGSLAVTDDGHVYVTNRAAPMIYRKTPDGKRLEAFFASVDLVALSDIAVTPDNSRVFVSDTYKGVLTIDPIGEGAALLNVPETMNLGGIESIEYRNGTLFLVQGGFSPQRLVRLELDANGAAAQSISPMAIALDEFDQPGAATFQDDSLYYIANSGAHDATGTVVLSTPLDAGIEVAPPDMAEFEQALRAKQQQAKD
jgi:hypothetical protein